MRGRENYFENVPESGWILSALEEGDGKGEEERRRTAADTMERHLQGSGIVLSRNIRMDGSGTGYVQAQIRGERPGPSLVFLCRAEGACAPAFAAALAVFRRKAEAVHRGEESLPYPLRLILILDRPDSLEETKELIRSGVLRREDLVLGLCPTEGRILASHLGRMETVMEVKAGQDLLERTDAISCAARILTGIRGRVFSLSESRAMGRTRVSAASIEGGEEGQDAASSCRARLVFHLTVPHDKEAMERLLDQAAEEMTQKAESLEVRFDTGAYTPPVEVSPHSRLLLELRDSIAAETGIRPEGETGPSFTDTALVCHQLGSIEAMDYGPLLSGDEDSMTGDLCTAESVLERLIANVGNGPLEEEVPISKKIFSGLENLPSGSASRRILPGCLVLEGGAFRGLYTQGVLDAFMEEGINLQTVIGVSAGALSGMCYVSGQIGRGARINLRYRHDDRYVGLKAFRRNRGLIGFDFVFFGLDEEYPLDRERFLDPDRRFLAAATSCETGETVCFDRDTCSDIFQAVRASASMPFVSRPVLVDGIPCLDGGCGDDKIPVRWALDQGFEKIVVIRTRERSYRIEADGGRTAAVARRFYRKYPRFAEKLSDNNTSYNALLDRIDALEEEGRIYVIAPSQPPEVGRVESDMEKLGALYYMGYHDARLCLPSLRAYLGMKE